MLFPFSFLISFNDFNLKSNGESSKTFVKLFLFFGIIESKDSKFCFEISFGVRETLMELLVDKELLIVDGVIDEAGGKAPPVDDEGVIGGVPLMGLENL